jgi:Cupin-like domain
VVLFDAPLLHHCPALSDRVRVPKYFPRDYYLLLDWIKGVDPRNTRNWPSIIVSKKGGGTFLHADSGMTRFWAQMLSGRKRWRVFPLRESHNLAPSPHLHYYYPIVFEMDAFHPDFEKYPDAVGVPVYEVITEPGDVIFIPEGWAHQVENLEDSVITSMNFWDNHAIETATRELPYTLHLTSGAELLSAFFFPLDNRPVRPNFNTYENIEFDNYFAQRFLAQETVVPQSVIAWVEEGGKQAIDMERDAWGLPALHVAVYYDFFCVLQFLIELGGADVNVQSKDNVTALDFAEWNGRWEMRNVLRYSYGARGRLDAK